LTGRPLQVGATYGGVDFLVLVGSICIGWVICTAPPRRSRALCAAAILIGAQLAYLVLLAYADDLLALLPDFVPSPKSETSWLGLSTWSNGLRSLIPWNLPLVAMLLDCGIVATMLAGSSWKPIVEVDEATLKRQRERQEKEEIPDSAIAKGVLFHFGPVLLVVLAALSGTLTANQPDLKGKKIVAYAGGSADWAKPAYDSPAAEDAAFGMLPLLVESLGGEFLKSHSLSADDLAKADVLLLIRPKEPWPAEALERASDYVRRGGAILLAGGNSDGEGTVPTIVSTTGSRSRLPRFDTALSRTGNWEQSYEIMSHPATAGINDLRNAFGLQFGSTVGANWRWRPVLVGRWGWSEPGRDAARHGSAEYKAGEPLGDLVLAAEQRFDKGCVFVLGDTKPLDNASLPGSFEFVGRLFSYLADRPSSPQAFWRQCCTLAGLLAMIGLLAGRPVAWQVMLTSATMAVSLVCCTAMGDAAGRILPDGRIVTSAGAAGVACVDASHLEAYATDSRRRGTENLGISEFLRTLMRQGYLPLLAPDLSRQRLDRCQLLVSIAPAREFSQAERADIKQFVSDGGTFLCMAGAENARPGAPLLADFGFKVPRSPVAPGDGVTEPAPLGHFQQTFGTSKRYVQFYAGWPVECTQASSQDWISWSDGKQDLPVVAWHAEGSGAVAVIGDTHFAANENIQRGGAALPDQIQFWRWLFSRVVPGQKEWNPPPAANADSSGTVENDDEMPEK
jgi:hypothetical protein